MSKLQALMIDIELSLYTIITIIELLIKSEQVITVAFPVNSS